MALTDLPVFAPRTCFGKVGRGRRRHAYIRRSQLPRTRRVRSQTSFQRSSMADDQNNSGAGRSLGGGAAEPMPASWRTNTSAPRVGRVGGPSTFVAFLWNSYVLGTYRSPLPFALYYSAARSSAARSGGARIASLNDIASSGGGGGGPAPHGHGDDDSDDEDSQERLFAGGERR